MEKSFSITKEVYDYMLPVFGIAGMMKCRLLLRVVRGVDYHYFIGTEDDYKDLLNRCKYIK